MFKITEEWIHENSTHPCGSGFTRAQLRLLGEDWPVKGGWIERVVGKPITLDDKLEFESFRNTAKSIDTALFYEWERIIRKTYRTSHE